MTPKIEKRGLSPAAALAAAGMMATPAAAIVAKASRRELSACMATDDRALLAWGAKAEAEATRVATRASFMVDDGLLVLEAECVCRRDEIGFTSTDFERVCPSRVELHIFRLCSIEY